VGETVDIEARLQEVTLTMSPETASAEPVADEAAEAPAAEPRWHRRGLRSRRTEEPASPKSRTRPPRERQTCAQTRRGYVIPAYAGTTQGERTSDACAELDVGDTSSGWKSPPKEVTEIKKGPATQVNSKVAAGYILVRMD